LGEWKSVLSTASALRFDTLLLSFPKQNVFADVMCGDLDIARLVGLARDRALQIIFDAPVSSVPAMTTAARMLDLSESELGICRFLFPMTPRPVSGSAPSEKGCLSCKNSASPAFAVR
jgi:hypothetical protein